jgi:radical SAM protein with 4Fe4S-binding SPASM domain
VLKSNVMTFNVHELDALAALAAGVGAGMKLDPGMRARTDGDRRPLDWAPSTEELRRKVLARADLSPQLTERSPDEVCDGTRSLVDPDGALCGAARETLAIGADGGVYACSFFPRPAGNVRHRPLTEIWRRSPDLDAVRRTTAADLTQCGTCAVRGACRPCMAQAEIDSGDRRGCNETSRGLAEALYELARRKRTANRRMAGGRQLRVVDAEDVGRPAPPGGGAWRR